MIYNRDESTSGATQGLYSYRTRNYDGSFNTFIVPVEIVGETTKSYRIRLLKPLCGQQVGKHMTVRRHNVRLANFNMVKHVDTTGEWWQN